MPRRQAPREVDQTRSAGSLFSCSRRLTTAEHLGITCALREQPAAPGIERLRTRAGAELLWHSACAEEPAAARARAQGSPTTDTQNPEAAGVQSRDQSIPIFATLLGDREAVRALAQYGGEWSRALSIVGQDGERLGSIWSARDGSVFLPFDPDEVCHNYYSERYLALVSTSAGRRTRRGAMRVYYRMRGLLPRGAQIWLRRGYARRQARTPFPSWPAETALHDFFDLFLSILADVAGEPVPRIAPWPHGCDWALVLTHDVETSDGLAALDPIIDIERGLGLRSSWNFVPRRYEVDDERIRDLHAAGFEVGVHGLYHDGRDLQSRARLQERLPGMREAAERWSAVGFRSPATHRQWELMALLGFDYDSSYPDTDPFEPQGGGCCTWLPFFNGEMLELPLTMPQDHTMFVILRHRDETAWVRKADFLRARGGMALIDTHPDYLIEDRRMMDAYTRLLERYATDGSAWKALPRDVSAWWRRRAASRVQRSGTDWIVTGPAAAEARVQLMEGKPWR
jgi:peptidoglycan/xylan/chitin deacetylase (PgdA/CDA1 family)